MTSMMAIFFLIFFLGTSPVGIQEGSLEPALKQFENKQFDEAKDGFERLAGRDPDDARPQYYLGRIAFQQGRIDDAIKCFELAVKLDDKNSSYRHWLGQAYGRKARTASMLNRAGYISKVREQLTKSLELDPENIDARADFARFLNEVPAFLGGSDKQALEQAAMIEKRDAFKGRLLAGELLADRKRYPEAEAAYLEAEKLQPSNFEAAMKRGFMYQSMKEYDKAFEAFEKILKTTPDHFPALFQIGRTSGMSGRNLDRGLKAFEQVKPQIPPGNKEALIGMHWWRGKIYEAMGEKEKARADYEIVLPVADFPGEVRAAIERVKPAPVKREPGLLSLEPTTYQSFDGESVAAEYGRIMVPENRKNSSGRLIELAFVRIKTASSSPRSPVVYLSGGPGGSGIVSGRVTEFFKLVKAMREHADVILLDQRGTGASVPHLGCAETFADLPANGLNRIEDSIAAFKREAAKCADRLRKEGVDFNGYNILESADDVEDLRKALKIEKVSLWGYSYGSQLAFAMLRRHEKSIDRLIVMGVESVANTEKLPADFDKYIDTIAEMCRKDPRTSSVVQDLKGLMRSVFSKLDAQPIELEVVNFANGEKRRMIIGGFGLKALTLLTILNNTRSLPVIPSLFHSLSKGDHSILSEMIGAVLGRNLFSANFYLIDGASGATAARRAQIERESRDSLFGNVINFPFPYLNEIWKPVDLGDEFREPVKSKAPALFISGSLDANTPPHRAEEARKGFPNSAHLIIENAGHQDLLRGEGIIESVADFIAGKKVESRNFHLPLPEFAPVLKKKG